MDFKIFFIYKVPADFFSKLSAISVPDSDSNFFLNINIWILRYLFHVKINVKCKGNFMEVKCFVICTDLLLPLKVNFSYFEIQIFMSLKLESESAMQKICSRIRNPNPLIFLPDCHPWSQERIIKYVLYNSWPFVG